MTALHSESMAFRLALLKSERLRISILSLAVGLGLFLRVLRTMLAWNDENARTLFWLLLAAAIFAAMEGLMLRAIRRAVKAQGQMSEPMWMANILVETLLPAVLIAFISSPIIPGDYRALVSPAFLLYFVLISLSTLRLTHGVNSLRPDLGGNLCGGRHAPGMEPPLDAGPGFALLSGKNGQHLRGLPHLVRFGRRAGGQRDPQPGGSGFTRSGNAPRGGAPSARPRGSAVHSTVAAAKVHAASAGVRHRRVE